jgi:ADP-heptose:LPS heptosyltransferase
MVAPFEFNPKMAITGAGPGCTRLSNTFMACGGEPVEYIEGSCLMIPTALARKHGLFAKYLKFIYWEDTDLSFRMRELGYEIQTVKIPMKHRHPSTTTKTMDLREIKQHNAEQFKSRWKFYVSRRTFERRVLIRRLGARGDVLLLAPVLRAMREKWPQAEIQIETKHPEMLQGMDGVKPAINGKNYFDNIYDLDLSYEKRPEVHIVQAYADVLDVSLPRNWKIEMFPTEEESTWGFRRSRGEKVALIHAGITTWPGKNWPLERMADVVRHLKGLGYFTIAVGATDSPQAGCDDTVAGQASPQQLYALARHAALFVGLDSMPQHVMSASNVPSVIMFGPTNPRMIVRPTPRIIPVQASTDDAPCAGEHGRRKVAVTQAPCDGACARAVTVPMMLKAINRLIALGI